MQQLKISEFWINEKLIKKEEYHPLFSKEFQDFETINTSSTSILAENLPEIAHIYGGRCLVRREFFMPRGLELLDMNLDPDYWAKYKKVVENYGGMLISCPKQVHHIQIAPKGVKLNQKQIEENYHPGLIFKLNMIE
jgi:hypothetical protein